VLFISLHQDDLFPASWGAVDQVGADAGRGFTVNIPLPAGTGDAGYELTYATQVVPALQDFKPDVILVSAGFDAHIDDPLAGMRVTTAGFRNLMAILDDAARQLCGRRIALVTEGGYDLAALRACLDTAIEVFGG
jgi:acetoin utilization deacetylase AcuC-like enzyme